MGTDAFFQTATTQPSNKRAEPTNLVSSQAEKPERRSFNLKPSTLRLLDEIQIKTIRDGDKWTLSAIVEQGIALVAEKMGVDEQANM
jgi:hypothetical protein